MMDFLEAKEKAGKAKDSKEFFDVFKELASSIGLDLSEYSDKLDKRFEPKKPLTDKIELSNEILSSCPVYHATDVREAIKEFITRFVSYEQEGIKDKLKEVFGERLL